MATRMWAASLTILLAAAFGVLTAATAPVGAKAVLGCGRPDGTYLLVLAAAPESGVVTTMRVRSDATGRLFFEGADWTAEGRSTGDTGYYNWRFTDGRKGRTTVRRAPNCTLVGHVVGAGLDWHHVARRGS